MQKLREVESAKELLNEARSWSVMKWLAEKKRVRKTADQANAVLEKLVRDVKATWSEEARTAYQGESAQANHAASPHGSGVQGSAFLDPDVRLEVKRIVQADNEAYRARMDAENTFDEAERRLSTAMAREGCEKAIHSWELYEKAIRKAEALSRSGKL